jgi:16S rRNA (guanine527-N7)-methyltransferase
VARARPDVLLMENELPDNEVPNDVPLVLEGIGEVRSRLDPAALRCFLEELLRWNPQLGLVSKQDTPRVLIRLIRQSVALWDFARGAVGEARLSGVERIADIGSGGGFPGLIWKMLSPSREFLLIERKERKVAFLDRVIARTSLAGVSALAADLREVARRESYQQRFDVAVMAAVAAPSDVAASIERLLRSPGYFCTVRGRSDEWPGERLGGRLALIARQDTLGGRFVLYEALPPA